MWLKYLVGFFVSFQREDELCRLMNLYIIDHRPLLVMESGQHNLLLGSFEKERESLAISEGGFVVSICHTCESGAAR